MDEFNRIRRFVHRPLTGVDDVVRLEPAVTRLVRPANRADADPDEALPRLRFVVAESGAVGQEFLYGTSDRVMQLRIVALEPLPEVVVPVPLQTGDDTGPIE